MWHVLDPQAHVEARNDDMTKGEVLSIGKFVGTLKRSLDATCTLRILWTRIRNPSMMNRAR